MEQVDIVAEDEEGLEGQETVVLPWHKPELNKIYSHKKEETIPLFVQDDTKQFEQGSQDENNS